MCSNCRDLDRNSCTDIVSSNCIPWQGLPVPELEICLGDSLTYIGNIILAKIKDLLKGRGIVLEDLTISDCEYISDILGVQEKNLLNILKVYKQAICNLENRTTITEANLLSFTNTALYTLGCIGNTDPCGDNLTFKTMIQAIITKVCELNTQISGIASSILAIVEEATGNFIVSGAIKSCGNNGLTTSGTGASAQVVLEALVPPMCPIVYLGSLSYFDNTGVGLPNTPYCGWYLCNGNNNTPNSAALPQNTDADIVYIIRFN